MGTPKATLAGIPLTNSAAVGWEFTPGAAFPTRVFTVHEKEWSKIEKVLGTEVSLIIETDDETLEIKRLVPLRRIPSTVPWLESFLVTDFRWFWQYQLIHKDYNIRRRSGLRKLVNGEVIEVAEGIDKFRFVAPSLDNGLVWTPQKFLEDVIGTVTRGDFIVDSIPTNELNDERGVTVQDLRMSENGNNAVAQALAQIPGTEIAPDAEGKIHIFDATDLTQTNAVLDGAGPQTVAGQIDKFVDLSPIRPRRVDVYFHREIELRFDSIEEGRIPWSSTLDPGSFGDMESLVNVLPLPDPLTEINGEQVPQGTWVPIQTALEAWEAQFPKVGLPELNIRNVREFWFLLESVWSNTGDVLPSGTDANWEVRMSTLRSHYRQTYMIPRSWMERISQLKEYRVSVLDNVTGYRGPARAWSAFTRVATTKWIVREGKNDRDKQAIWPGYDKYPGVNANLDNDQSSPASVDLVDGDLGIWHIDYRTDQPGFYSTIHPSLMKQNQDGNVISITRDFSQGSDPNVVKSIDHKLSGAPSVSLAQDHRVAIVFTAVPGAPNSKRRLQKVEVHPEDVFSSMKDTFQVDGGKGPTMEVYIPPSLMTAWWAWADVAARESAVDIFGFGGNPDAIDPGASEPNFTGFEAVNFGSVRGMVESVARAVAVSIWSGYTSSQEGERVTHLNPDVRAAGNVEVVGHTLATNGATLTTIAMPSKRRAADPVSLLPKYVRQFLLHTPDGPG